MKKLVLLIILTFVLIGSVTTQAEECKHENIQKFMWNSEEEAFLPYCRDCNSSLTELQNVKDKGGEVKTLKIFLTGLAVCFSFVGVVWMISTSGSSHIQDMDLYNDDDNGK